MKFLRMQGTENHQILDRNDLKRPGLKLAVIPKDSILKYETGIKTGKFILIVHGTADEAVRARKIIIQINPETLEHHQ